MGVAAWVSPGDPPGSGTVSPPSRQARGNVTAGLFFCECDHRHGQAPWPGPPRGLAGRAEAPHARGARAGPSAGGYGSASLLSSPRLAIHPTGTREANPGEPTFRGPFTGRPGRRWGLFCEGRYEPTPAVGVTQRCTCRVESSAAGRWHEGATGWGRGARGAGPGRVRGLRPWCGWPRELAQDVADVLLTVSRLMNSSRRGPGSVCPRRVSPAPAAHGR